MNTNIENLLSTTPRQPTLEVLLRDLRDLVYTEDLVPLGKHRMPFADITDETIIAFTCHALTHPETLGRMSVALRRYLGLALPCPLEFVIKESHIDVSDISGGLADKLISLGFEADHFAELNPREYEWCFTMKFEIPRASIATGRVCELDHLMMARTKIAQAIVDAHPTAFCYMEVETYTNDTKHRYPFIEVSQEGLQKFPFQPNDFEVLRVPDSAIEEKATGISLDTHKYVDVHAKIPTPYKGLDYRCADSNRMNRLRKMFLMAGFYEIFSEAGNYIYTVQSLDIPRANVVFNSLDRFARKHGGIIGLNLELCKYFWRKARPDIPEQRLSPIPPLTTIRPEAYTRLMQSC